MRCAAISIVGLVALLGCCAVAAAGEPDGAAEKLGTEKPTAEQLAAEKFFEQRIRPVLAERCYECHAASSKSPKGGLRVDTREALLRGGDSGPTIVPGKAAESLLMQALRHEGPEMPPQGKLSAEIIADFARWIDAGAVDPRVGDAGPAPARVIDIEAGRKFWAFRPVARPAVPELRNTAWPRSDIDRFILAQLEAKGLSPVDDAERRVLLRRASYDLLGLPPTPEEVAAFLSDDSPDAFAKVVDRLLASPRFGERWGRHWLDVARFAESTGGGRSMLFGSAWQYRDYVIAALNDDKPYDQFIVEQLAGDLLPYDELRRGTEQIVATAFLALGPTNYEEQDKAQLRMDVIDEQIDTTGRAFLALSLGCARCHDHKFDPIPTTDYYALAGIFGSTQSLVHDNVSKWVERALPIEPAQQNALAKYHQAKDEMESQLKQLQQQRAALAPGGKIENSAQGPRIVKDASELPGIVVDTRSAEVVGQWTQSTSVPSYVGNGYLHDGDAEKGRKSVTFRADLPQSGEYEVRLSYAAGTNRATHVPINVTYDGGAATVYVNQREQPAHDGLFCPLGTFRFANDQTAVVTVANEGAADGHVIADAVQFVPVAQTRAKPDGKDAVADQSPAKADTAKEADALNADQRRARVKTIDDDIAQCKANLKRLEKSAPPEPPEVMSVKDEPQPADARVCIRGDKGNLGAVVPRGFVTVAQSSPPSSLSQQSSGRLELARWIASPDNPLTARVMVNRVWHHLFGVGIVRTVDNFGAMGELPSHPELLDYLAGRFVELRWSTKALLREIMLSRTYQLASTRCAMSREIDPENRLLAAQNRRRLEAEAIYDSLLLLGGTLDLAAGGDTIRPGTKAEYGYEFVDARRAVYVPVFRNRLHDLFAVFDFPDPNLSIGGRTVSTLSTQALFLMNNPLVLRQARSAAQRLLEDADQDAPADDGTIGTGDGARIDRLYEWALGRPPTERERTLAEQFRAVDGATRLERWTQFCQAMMLSIDFRYIE